LEQQNCLVLLATGTEVLKSPDLFSGEACPVPQGPWVGVYVTDGQACAIEGDGASPPSLVQRASACSSWFGKVRSFWLSFDRSNCCVKFGEGHYREETTLLAVPLSYTGKIFPLPLSPFRSCTGEIFPFPLSGGDLTLALSGCRCVYCSVLPSIPFQSSLSQYPGRGEAWDGGEMH
jgi:hypothetical protein